MSQKLGSSLLKQASERQISSLRWAPGATFRNPWDPDPPCSSGFLLMTLSWVGSHVLAPGNDGYLGPIKQLVKLIRPPENWTAVSAVKWLYQLYWNQNIKRMVFPLSLPGPSYQRPSPAGACVSPLASQEANVWFPLWEMIRGLSSRSSSFPLFRACLSAACARLCAQHGQPSPIPERSSGAEALSGLTNPRASALISFLTPCYYRISSVLCGTLLFNC